MYGRSAQYYDALYQFKDYEAAAHAVHRAVASARPGARTLLDVACGTGKHLETLRQWYDVQGLDISADLLAVARGRLGDVRLHQQDMSDMHTGERYDVIVCLFSAIAYVRTPDNLRRTFARFVEHLGDGGLIIVEPYFSPQQYWTDRVTVNVVDEPDLKIAWMYSSPPPVDNIASLDIHHLVGTPQGVEHFVERHEMGLFTDEDYADAFNRAGLVADFDPVGFSGRGAFMASVAPSARHGG